MDDHEQTVLVVARAISFAALWVAIAVAVFRIGVPSLWGSGSDLGLIAAVGLVALAIPGLAWLAVLMLRNIKQRLDR